METHPSGCLYPSELAAQKAQLEASANQLMIGSRY